MNRKYQPASLKVAVALLLAAGVQITSRGEVKTWSAAAGDMLWSSGGNWDPAGAPAAGDNVTFGNVGWTDLSYINGGALNSVVDAGFAGTIKSLDIRNIQGFHNISLTKPLRIEGTAATDAQLISTEVDGNQIGASLLAGGGVPQAAADLHYSSIIGDSLIVNNPAGSIIVRQESATAGAHRATLDLTALLNFTATVKSILVGHDWANQVTRPTGTLILAENNTISARVISVGEAYQNTGQANFMYLGKNNTLNVDRLRIAMHKCVATLGMALGLEGPNVRIRGYDGEARSVAWEVGDEYEPNTALGYFTSSQSTGTIDLSGATVDAMVDEIVLGRGQIEAPTRNGDGNGTLIFGAGTINANTVKMGIQLTGGPTAGRGTLTINNEAALPAKLHVNGDMTLAQQLPGNTEATGSVATINLNGGVLEVAGNMIDAGGNVTVNLNAGGVLDLMPEGDSTRGNLGVNTLNVSGGTLRNVATLEAGAINLAGSSTEFVVEAASTLSPVGALTVAGGNLVLRGALLMDVQKAGAVASSDSVAASGLIDFGGTLTVRRSGDALAVGDKFTLFAGAIPANAFTMVTLPAPGAGLAWSNKLEVDGSIEVVSGGEPVERPTLSVATDGANITLSWPVAYTSFVLQSATAIGGSWSPVNGVNNNSVTLPINTANQVMLFQLTQQP